MASTPSAAGPADRRGRTADRAAVRGRVAGVLAALCAVLLLDLALGARGWSIPAEAVLDESGHLLTAWLLLSAAGLPSGRLRAWALAGAVLIDLDHLPLYVGLDVAGGGGRPVSHSALPVLVLLVAARLWPAQRTRLAGLALGVGLHLVRDLADGPGVPLLWPLLDGAVLVPYPAYVVLLVAAAALACLRVRRHGGVRARPPGRVVPDPPPPR